MDFRKDELDVRAKLVIVIAILHKDVYDTDKQW